MSCRIPVPARLLVSCALGLAVVPALWAYPIPTPAAPKEPPKNAPPAAAGRAGGAAARARNAPAAEAAAARAAAAGSTSPANVPANPGPGMPAAAPPAAAPSGGAYGGGFGAAPSGGPYGSGYPSGQNPYAMTGGAYGAGVPPYGGYGGGQGGGTSSSSGSGGGQGKGQNPYTASRGSGGQGNAQNVSWWVDPATALATYGVPNRAGQLSWPLAFRLMTSKDSQELCEPLETQLRVATVATLQGRAVPQVVEEAGASVGRLRRWLRERRVGMAEATYRDGDRFLGKLQQAVNAMSGE